MKYLLFMSLLMFCTLLTSCSNQSEGKPLYAYLYTVAWNDNIYGITNERITEEQLGSVIGERNNSAIISPLPQRNGDIARSTPEGPPPQIIQDAKLYEIKGIVEDEAIAIEGQDGYYKCLFYEPLN